MLSLCHTEAVLRKPGYVVRFNKTIKLSCTNVVIFNFIVANYCMKLESRFGQFLCSSSETQVSDSLISTTLHKKANKVS